MADTLQPQITALQAQLHDAAAALGLAKQKGLDPIVIAQYQARFDALRSQVDDLVRQENANETPSGFEQTVGGIVDGVTSLVADVSTAVGNTVKAIGQTSQLLPLVLIAAIAVGAFFLYKKLA